MHVQNWDDYRFVAVLARTGSLAEKSQLLGVDRSTVQRRIKALEARLGYNLFLKDGARYTALPEAQPILVAARTLETAFVAPAGHVEGQPLSGVLSITLTDSVYLGGVSDMIDDFQTTYPALRLDLAITTRKLSLDSVDSDVAVRPSDSPPDHLVGRRICDLAFGVYASHGYLKDHQGQSRDEHDWLTVGDDMVASPPGRWIEANVPADRRVLRADTFIALAEACRLGRGAALIPKCYGSRLPELVPVPHLMDAPHTTGLWLLTHPDLRHAPRVRTFIDFIGKRLTKEKARFTG